MNRRHLLACISAAMTVGLHGAAQAQNMPSDLPAGKPYRIIAPSSPGGILDITSRLIAKSLGERIHQPVIVENHPGAGGAIGIQAMLRAEPDGRTLVMGSLGPNAANYELQKKLPYTFGDMTAVIHVLSMPDVVVVNPRLSVKSVADLKQYASTKPDGLSMAVSTSGSSGHLAGALLNQRTGIRSVDVIYKGASPALTDLIAGQVDYMVDNLITALPLIRGGKIRPIAVTTRERSSELPDVPTLVELGYPDFDVSVWLGLFVSSKTPPAVVKALNAELNTVLADPDVRKTIAQQGGAAVGGSPQDFERFVQREKDRWTEVIRVGKIQSD
ncbi:tripartite tricarboxylate transporter substrate binding protein [Diaphorobacter sp. HDW4A]|uniref:Bug family tripartite tricarboxylate transporter substrate binding protein n=1 Tax=Diaphorobacter sp. HDW4A TaxID=2714924 RepID=UPI00140BFD3E|nr:tripartite tricarboxylate transporter substrate binding protein [Diaphorobacter sp. HDW4A]QIL81579.1 tripartite tricarboxylate transporter substrate binding protein [Diaphorobacter sp. HDW4A]